MPFTTDSPNFLLRMFAFRPNGRSLLLAYLLTCFSSSSFSFSHSHFLTRHLDPSKGSLIAAPENISLLYLPELPMMEAAWSLMREQEPRVEQSLTHSCLAEESSFNSLRRRMPCEVKPYLRILGTSWVFLKSCI